MTTESLQPSGFLNSTSGSFLNSEAGSFLNSEANPSLLESKKSSVAAISEAKKQALDPSIVSAKDLFVIDADTVRNETTGVKTRFTPNLPGVSYDPFEVPHPDKPLDQARINNNIDALVADNPSLNRSYFSNESVFRRGREAEEKLRQTFKELGNVGFIPTGEKDKWGRPLADVIDPTTGQSLLPDMNNPEVNADYHSKYNIVKEGQDLIQKAAERELATEFSVSDDNLKTLLGGAANLATTAGVAFGDSVGRVLKSPALLAQSLRETGITQKQRDLYESLNTKFAAAEKAGVDYTPTAEEQTILESPLQAFKRETLKPVMDGERGIAASDFLNLASVAQPGSMSVFQKLSASDRVNQTYTEPLNAVHDAASQLINTSGTDELHRQTEGLANDAVLPSIAEGYKKFKGGKEVDGALQIADAVANHIVGTGRIAANNKQAAIEEIGRILPDMLMAGVSMAALFAGLGTETEAEAVKGYVKEHGVHPEGAALVRLRLDTWSSAALDSVADKYLGSSAGATKAVAGKGAAEALTSGIGGINSVAAESLASSIGGRALSTIPGFIKVAGNEDGTEIVQNLLEQDAAKQDLSKIDLGEALSAGSLGAIGGAGINVASHPIEAIKEAGSAVATVGKTALNLASKLVPAGVSDAVTTGTQAVSNAVGSVSNAVTDSIAEVNSSTTIPTVDPIEQAAKTENSMLALTELLKPENTAVARATPEGKKAFELEATRHNLELLKEFTAIGAKPDATTEDGARAKVLLTAIRTNREKIYATNSIDAEADTTDADIALATTKPVEGIADSPDKFQAADRVIRSMRQPDKVSLTQAESLQANATLTPEQSSVVTAFIATKKALTNMSDVSTAVINGKGDFIGMLEHQEMLSDALGQDNIPVAKSVLDGFRKFAASQVKKAASLKAIMATYEFNETTKKYESVDDEARATLSKQFARDFPSPQGFYSDKAVALNVLTNQVTKEADLLKTGLAESELHYTLATRESDTTSVEQKAGILTPVVYTDTPSGTEQVSSVDTGLATKAESNSVPVVEPITNAITSDPVTNNTVPEQVTTNTTPIEGNLNPDEKGMPITENDMTLFMQKTIMESDENGIEARHTISEVLKSINREIGAYTAFIKCVKGS